MQRTIDILDVVQYNALDEETRIGVWRFETFMNMGFNSATANRLAASSADLAQARRLAKTGCDLELALEILL